MKTKEQENDTLRQGTYEAKENFKRLIYELMNGSRNIDEYPVKESRYVENEFIGDKVCNLAYQQIFEANQRLCERLDTDEDVDIGCIISSYSTIMEHLCMKMYDYGVLFSHLKNGDNDLDSIIHFFYGLNDEKKENFMKMLYTLNHMINGEYEIS